MWDIFVSLTVTFRSSPIHPFLHPTLNANARIYTVDVH